VRPRVRVDVRSTLPSTRLRHDENEDENADDVRRRRASRRRASTCVVDDDDDARWRRVVESLTRVGS
jgi:hypothetical protein